MASDNTQRLVCQVDYVKPLTDHIVQISLHPINAVRFHYLAGQYLKIITADGQQTPFSIASAPLGGKQIELHICHTKDNIYSNTLLKEVQQTGRLTISGPFGHCIYHKEFLYPTILLAGGTGFAPLKAIIEQALAEGDNTPKHLYWGAKAASDLYLHELAQHWAKTVENFRYTAVLSEPADNWQGKTGLVHAAVVQDYTDLSHYQIYAAGPPDMVFIALQAFELLGLPRDRVYSDAL